ncbi:hypothetical protein BH23ACT6_BH23ACT6_21480 [soil metagenome]
MAVTINEHVWTSAPDVAHVDPLESIETALQELDVPAAVAEGLVALLACHQGHRPLKSDSTGRREDTPRRHESVVGSSAPVASEDVLASDTLLDATQGARAVQSFADAMLVTAARTLADRAGREFLGRKGLASPVELTPTARQRWRAKTKSVVAEELATLTGYGVNACHARVGFALAPRAAVRSAERALFEGVTDWRAVSQYWQRCRTMEVEDATQVGDAVFAPLLVSTTPEDADPSGDEDQRGARWETWQEFHRRLERESVRVEGRDAAAERERRRAALRRRDTHAEIEQDGLGSFYVTAGTASVVAAAERIETIARRARKAGDTRSLGHIRSDTAMALLVHGILPLSEAPTSKGEMSPAASATSTPKSEGEVSPAAGATSTPQSEAGKALVSTPDSVCRIIAGLPTASVDVIVPVSALLSEQAPTEVSASRNREDIGESVVKEKFIGEATGPASRAGHTKRGDPIETGRGVKSNAPGVKPNAPGAESDVPGGVAEIPGHGWLSAAHARELAVSPGAVLHRLLTDPADGRLVERTTTAYRPDAAMRAQVRALDRSCRAPGCTMPAHRCELDHETPFGTPGGVTSETNLNPKHARHHQLKTEQFWTSVMDETRAVTWTTLFSRMYTTYAHDYREYDSGSAANIAQVATADDPDLRDQLIYAALSTREGQDSWLQAMDDDPEHPDGQWSGMPLSLFHRESGRRRRGSSPHLAAVGRLLRGEATPAVQVTQPSPIASVGPPPF